MVNLTLLQIFLTACADGHVETVQTILKNDPETDINQMNEVNKALCTILVAPKYLQYSCI